MNYASLAIKYTDRIKKSCDFLILPAYALTLFVSAVLAMPAFAQMSLRDAVLIASERDPGITALRHEISRRTIDIQTVRDQRYPQANLSAETSNTSSDRLGLTLTVSQVLYDWGKVRNMIESASQDRVVAVSDLKMAIEEITLDVSHYYIDIEVIDQKIAHTREYLQFARRIAEHAEARRAAGRGDNGEVARARLEVGRTEQRRDQLSSDRMLALAQLEFLLGRDPGLIASPANLNFVEIYEHVGAIQAAIRLSPAYVSANARFTQAESEVGVARAARKPTIKLQAQVRSDLNRGRTRSSIGLSAGIDVGAGTISGRQIESARLRTEAARSNMDAVSRNLSNAARTALERIRVLRANENAQRNQLAQAQQVLDNYEQQFVGGQRELIDLLTTGRDLYDAQIDRIDTYDERRRTEYRAAFDLGVLGTLILSSSDQG